MARLPGHGARRRAACHARRQEGLGLRLAIFGTGALASWIGARLARAGDDVTLVGTWGEALNAISRNGLRVEDAEGSWVVSPRVAWLGQALAPAELALVLVKSHQTPRVADAARDAVAGDGLILTLQNGLGNRELLATVAGSERVALGAAFLGATLVGPAHVRAGGGARIVLDARARIGAAATRLRAAGFEIQLVSDIERTLWQKLVVNCAINPLTAILTVTNGELLDGGGQQATLEAAAREVASVARALGIDVGDDPAGLAVAVARETAGNRSSMLQDVERGARTEIDALNAAVVRQAEALDIPVPVNARLVQALRAVEQRHVRRGGADPGGRRPGGGVDGAQPERQT